jgi:6,7-dimethyl-8-ribityllumazine synthase
MKQEKKNAPKLKFKSPPHVMVIEARFYDHINDMLLDGALEVLKAYGATHDILTVPGALEIPAALQFCAKHSIRIPVPKAYIVLGCVIRGATTHYETVCSESNRGVMDLTLRHDLAVGNGILTVENEAQAIERADAKQLDKGGGAALAALTMLALKQSRNFPET